MIVTASATLLVAFALLLGPISGPVATIDGVTVSESEIQTVLAADPGLAAAPDHRAAAVAQIGRDRVLFELGRAAGLVDAPSLEALLDRRPEVNAERAREAASGDVVYGAVQYTEQDFRSRTLSQLRLATVRALASGTDPILRVSDADIDAYFDAHRGDWTAVATDRRFRVTRLPMTSISVDRLDRLRRGATPAFRACVADIRGVSVRHVTWTAATLEAASVSPSVRAELTDLSVGQRSSPTTERGQWVVYELESADVDEQQARTAYAAQIRALLLDQRLDALIDARAAQQDREVH